MTYHVHSDKPAFELIIGDKYLSSWSLRAWLVAVQSGLTFKELVIQLDQPTTPEKIGKYSPSNKVPALRQGQFKIWDSLAIAEYLNEISPEANLWPEDIGARALARSYAAEMHSGFPSLRAQLSMDLHVSMEIRHLTPGTICDIQRILEMWETALSVSQGPFLFGDFCIADAFFAPVVLRFVSYGIKIKDPGIKRYMKNIQEHHGVQFWVAEALKEKPVRPVF